MSTKNQISKIKKGEIMKETALYDAHVYCTGSIYRSKHAFTMTDLCGLREDVLLVSHGGVGFTLTVRRMRNDG